MRVILQRAVFQRPGDETDLLSWWNGHRRQDARDIITIIHEPQKIIVYYRCEVPDNWSPPA